MLRDARSTDAGKVGAILSAFIDETPWMPRLHSRAEDVAFSATMIDRGWVRVAETESAVAGFLAREGTEVHALYVHPAHRRRGIGGALIQDAQAHTRHLTLATFQANVAAQHFYERHGFAETGRGSGKDNAEGLPDMTFRWDAETGSLP